MNRNNKIPLLAIMLAAGAFDLPYSEPIQRRRREQRPEVLRREPRMEPPRRGRRNPGPDDLARMEKAQQKRERRNQRNLQNNSLQKK